METFIAALILCILLVFKPKLFLPVCMLIIGVAVIVMLFTETKTALIWIAGIGVFIAISLWVNKSNEKEKKELSELIELVNENDGKTTIPVIKKRSPKLGFYVEQIKYNYYFYQKKDPYLRTIRIGHASTTEYVDDSGLVPGGVEKTDRGMMVYKNAFSQYFSKFEIYISDEVYHDFVNNFEESSKYKIRKRTIGDRSIHYIDLCLPVHENLGFDKYCKIGNAYVETSMYQAVLASYPISNLVKLCNWFNSEALDTNKEIEKFQKLTEQGVITEEELEKKKQQLTKKTNQDVITEVGLEEKKKQPAKKKATSRRKKETNNEGQQK